MTKTFSKSCYCNCIPKLLYLKYFETLKCHYSIYMKIKICLKIEKKTEKIILLSDNCLKYTKYKS